MRLEQAPIPVSTKFEFASDCLPIEKPEAFKRPWEHVLKLRFNHCFKAADVAQPEAVTDLNVGDGRMKLLTVNQCRHELGAPFVDISEKLVHQIGAKEIIHDDVRAPGLGTAKIKRVAVEGLGNHTLYGSAQGPVPSCGGSALLGKIGSRSPHDVVA